MRLDTVSLRGLFNQQIRLQAQPALGGGFAEFEQRTRICFNGDPMHAMKKGFMILDRVQVSHMAQMQNMLDFPPAPKLTPQGDWTPRGPLRANGGANRCSSARGSAPPVIPHRSILITRCTISASSDLSTKRLWDQSDVYAPRHQGEPAVPP